jgi:DNA-binding transcriptional ArsR family regulator
MLVNSKILEAVRAELQSVETQIEKKQQELQELRETLQGLKRLELRYSSPAQNPVEEPAPPKPLTIAGVILDILGQHSEVLITTIREYVKSRGITATDGTINSTLHELRSRGLVCRRRGLRGVWRLFKAEFEILEWVTSTKATPSLPLHIESLIVDLEHEYPAFTTSSPEYAVDCRSVLRALIDRGQLQEPKSGWVSLPDEKPVF